LPGCREWGIGEGGGEIAQTMDTFVSKCKNDEIKGERKNVSTIREIT
jgi:hypothetical protein